MVQTASGRGPTKYSSEPGPHLWSAPRTCWRARPHAAGHRQGKLLVGKGQRAVPRWYDGCSSERIQRRGGPGGTCCLERVDNDVMILRTRVERRSPRAESDQRGSPWLWVQVRGMHNDMMMAEFAHPSPPRSPR